MRKIITLFVLLLLLNCITSKKGGQKITTEEQTLKFNLEMLKQELSKDHKNPQTHLQLAMVYVKMDSVAQALAHFDSSLYYKPSYIDAMLEKGSFLLKIDSTQQGDSLFLEVLKTDEGEDYVAEVAARLGKPYQIHQLTSGNYNNAYGYYSPSGNRIVFQSDRDGNWEIYFMDSEGSQDLRITNDPAQNEMPVFSPDGKVIAYTTTENDSEITDRVEMQRDIYLMDIEGSKNARVIETGYDDWYPSFTDKENELVFASEMDDPRDVKFNERWSDIYLKDLNTGTLLRLTQNEADDGSPSVSRDGKWIVFNSNRDGNFQIYRMNKKGNLVEQLTFLNGNCGAPHFSHDGKKITFFAEIDGNYDIYTMTSSGKKLKRLTNNPAQDAYPCFSPDGRRILFHSNRSGKFQIYYIDLTSPPKYEDLVNLLEQKLSAF